MKIVTFTDGQGSQEWHEWRAHGIGSSDIATIMDMSPYQTKKQLWEEKCGYAPFKESSYAMSYGKQMEPIARQWINAHLSIYGTPLNIESKEEPILKASLDFYDVDTKTLIEIKCPVNRDTIDMARNGAYKDCWYAQVQWQMGLAGATKGMIAVWDDEKEGCILLPVVLDHDMVDEMQAKALRFWKDHVVAGIAPDAEKGDYIEIEDAQLHKLLLAYQDLSKTEKELSEQKKRIKEKIVAFGDDGDFRCGNFTIFRVAPRKSYDIEAMKEDGIDVEKYRKVSKSIGYYSIKYSGRENVDIS